MTRTRLWVAMIAALLLGGLLLPTHSARALSSDALRTAIQGTAKLVIMGPKESPLIGTCSATNIGDGYILTNFHCVGHSDLYGEDDTGMGLSNGDLYHPQGWIIVCPTQDDRHVPIPTYVAKVMSGSPTLDIAVLKIFGLLSQDDLQRLQNGEFLTKVAPVPNGALPLVAVPIGDSDEMHSGDVIKILGYPAVGGNYISVIPGEIGGVDDEDEDGEPDSFKTSAEIAGGNSGGLVINDAGDQIGIPTYTQQEQADKIGRLKMINFAKPLIDEAKGKGTGQGSVQPTTKGVLLKGQIVDADTQEGIENAILILLKPGVTLDQWDRSSQAEEDELIAAYGGTDSDGNYTTAPALARGQTYLAVVGAKGYQRVDGSIEITADDPNITEMETIALQSR